MVEGFVIGIAPMPTILMLAGCNFIAPFDLRGRDTAESVDGDGDTDMDSAVDGDGDTDVDGDADRDMDADADGDIDSDTDSDAESDHDVEEHPDADEDRETMSDADVDEGPCPSDMVFVPTIALTPFCIGRYDASEGSGGETRSLAGQLP